DVAGYPGLFGLAMAFGIVSVLISFAVPKLSVPHPAPPRVRDIVALARHPRLVPIMLATLLLGVAINAAYMFVAPFGRGLGLARIGPFFPAYSATSVCLRLAGRRTLDVLGPHRVATPGFVAYAVGVIGLALLPNVVGTFGSVMLVACGMFCGMGHGSLFPVLN